MVPSGPPYGCDRHPGVEHRGIALAGSLGKWGRSTPRRCERVVVRLPTQQRLISAARLELAWRGVRRSPKRRFLDAIVTDVTNGAQSLGELDFTRMARRAGLPAPSHQSVRTGAGGRVYLDISWDEVGLVVEIDGGHHALALNPIDDALRDNDRVVAGERVLRIPVIGFRIAQDRFMQQVRHTYDALCRR